MINRLLFLKICLFLLITPVILNAQFDSAPLKAKYSKVRFHSDSRSGNWFLQMGGGVQTLFNGNYPQQLKEHIQPTATLSVGKMLAPEWGVRLNTNGGDIVGFKQTVRYGTANIDFLLNLATLARGYREWRFFELTLFSGPGYLHTFSENVGYATDKATLHLGLISSFRLSRIVNLNIEFQNNIVQLPNETGGIGAITAGLNFKIGKRRYTAYVPEETLSYQTYRETLQFQAELQKLKNQVSKMNRKSDTIFIHDTVYIAKKAINRLRKAEVKQKTKSNIYQQPKL